MARLWSGTKKELVPPGPGFIAGQLPEGSHRTQRAAASRDTDRARRHLKTLSLLR